MRRYLIVLLSLLAGCGLPHDGPLVRDVESEAALKRRFPYEYVSVTPEIADIIGMPVDETVEPFAPELGAQPVLIAPGDQLSVTIVESGAGGLFSPPLSNGLTGGEQGARVVTLPDVTVDPAGRITVPFAGARRVAGMTTTAAAQSLQEALAGQAINPQVNINLTHGTATRVVVAGALHTPGEHVPQGDGERLLEAIALAGGAVDPPSECLVQLNRDGHVYRIRLQALLNDPAANVHVRNGDYIHVYSKPRTYTIMGAADKPAEGQLPIAGLSLAEALSRAGGLVDSRADAGGILLARLEPRDRMDRVWSVMAKEARLHGQDLSGEIAARTAHLNPSEPVPVLYQFDLGNGSGLFEAREIAIREKDLLYVPSASSTEIGKLLDSVRLRFDLGLGYRPD